MAARALPARCSPDRKVLRHQRRPAAKNYWGSEMESFEREFFRELALAIGVTVLGFLIAAVTVLPPLVLLLRWAGS
jgi:hypothetical protein